jgi:hypothetical protein
LARNPGLKYNLVVAGSFLDGNCLKLDAVCRLLERDFVLFTKMDVQNLDCQKDVDFLKKMKFKKEEYKEDEFAMYLFGLKVEYEVIVKIMKKGGLLSSILSGKRCALCLSMVQTKEQPKRLYKKKTSKVDLGAIPLCK